MVLPPIFHRIWPDKLLTMMNITVFNEISWFAGYYFAVLLCGRIFLNRFLASLDEAKYTAFLLTVFAMIQFGWTGALMDNLAGGLRVLLTGIFLYSFGGFLRKYNPFQKIRLYIFILVIILIYLLICLSGYNVTETNIEIYQKNAAMDTFIQTIPGYDNYSIVTLITAICLFEIFQRIRLPQSKVITFLGRSTFMVYLLHDNQFFYDLWDLRDWSGTLMNSPISFVLNILKWSGYTFAAGVCAYILYQAVISLLNKGRQLAIRDQQ